MLYEFWYFKNRNLKFGRWYRIYKAKFLQPYKRIFRLVSIILVMEIK